VVTIPATAVTDRAIRPAAVDDVPAILALIRELAVYERERISTVEATEAGLRTALFGPQPAVWAHVAELDGRVVGTAIWYVTFSTWTGRHGMHLEDFVVSEQARGTGLGVALFEELRRICVERGYPRLEWRVLDWNVDAERFYARRGGRRIPEWISWRLTP
jgi:GNAT superfamily N-acetyltransferase